MLISAEESKDGHTSAKTLNERICASGATPTSLKVGMILATRSIGSIVWLITIRFPLQ
jgi:hypothetical protein